MSTVAGPGSKVGTGAVEALRDVLADGQLIAVGGFGLCGIPVDLIEAVRDSGVRDLTIVSNNMGVDGKGLGVLLESGQVRKVLASYVGENKLFAAQYLAGQLEVEFNPQGTLAERLRAGGAGIPAFYTATGVGTVIAEGKPHADFDGRTYLLERGIVADVGLVHAYRADPDGNLQYRLSARNFNPLVAAAGQGHRGRGRGDRRSRRDRPGPGAHARGLRRHRGAPPDRRPRRSRRWCTGPGRTGDGGRG